MKTNKLLSISIIIAAIIIAMPLWQISKEKVTSAPTINLPDYASIEQQVANISSSSKVDSCIYSIDRTKLLLDVTYLHDEKEWHSQVLYKMDEYGRFLRVSAPEQAKNSFPIEIK